ncbi:gliding motility-associated C-terminal domain-containing protein [Galbibacter sp. BG1]|uniref:T9SS type B sorting domain-containing protein n=1 Tax=Galbibacter sp. BG1 TaxID=1170699 RepID=UPI0015BF0D62|nr:gliding motility-associated C-terminal domain-containing protein [Galbibacter sp. BG1]QLE03021.1 gliding motility-associated C-terminal domain-containing protein [Galbibacter sp. BG1]
MKKTTATFGIIFLLFLANSYGQKINAPQLHFEYACVNGAFNTFNATFSFDEKPFQADNKFFIELSDKEGSFSKPTVLKTVEGQNFSFKFDASFSLPQEVNGENYKIRLKSTSPEIIGASTAAFDAFFVPNETLVLNNYKDVSLCSTSGATISLDKDVADEYVWYKDGSIFKVSKQNSLQVTEPGEYYAEPYYGNCTGNIYSNLVIVNKGESFDVSILGNKSIEACTETTIVLQASIDNDNYIYTWYKNEEKINGLSSYEPKLEIDNSNGDQLGSYRLEVTNGGGCTSSSETVSVLQNKSTIVEVTSPLNAVIIGDNTATLSIKTNDKGNEINWFKNGELVTEGYNQSNMVVNAPGEYYAEVTSSNSCGGNVKSETFKVFEPVSFTADIITDSSYEACKTTNTQLKVAGIVGTLKNGDKITIGQDFFHNFQLRWLKDGDYLKNSNTSLTLDYKSNGAYQLEVTYKDRTYVSDKKQVVLGLPSLNLQIEKPVTCANLNGILSVTAIDGAEYKWYNGTTLINEGTSNMLTTASLGDYTVEVSYGGCAITSKTVTLDQNTEDLVEIYPGEQITVSPERVVEATATGGDSYEWKDADGNILSKTAFFSIKEEGIYTLTAQVGECRIEKTVTVDSNNVVEIPNVISPNNDSVNDKWTLPQKFINDPEVEVVICDSYGATVLKTNKYENNWPNSSMNTTVETPVFYYFVNKKGKNIKKGSITLVN